MNFLPKRKPGTNILDAVAKRVSAIGQTGWTSLASGWTDSATLFGTAKSSEMSQYYSKLEIVYACVQELATTAAEAPLQVYEATEDGSVVSESAEADEALSLFYDNEFYAYEDLIRLIVQRLSLTGAAFSLIGENGQVSGLVPLPTNTVTVQGSGPKLLGYELATTQGVPKHVPPEDILPIMYLDPNCYLQYVSPLNAAARRIKIDLEQSAITAEMLANRNLPGMVGRMKSPMTADQVQQIKDAMYASSGGGNESRGKLLLVPPSIEEIKGVEINDINMEALSGLTETRLCMIFGVPPIVIGSEIGLRRGTFANYDAARKSFYLETMAGLWRFIAGQLTRGLFRMRGNKNLSFRFDTSGIRELAEDDLAIANKSVVLLNADIIDRQEARAMNGLEVVEADDTEDAAGEVAGEVTEDRVLNGAQITAATQIVQSVADGMLPRDAGVGQLVVMFNLSHEQAESMLGSAGITFINEPVEKSARFVGKEMVPADDPPIGEYPGSDKLAAEVRKEFDRQKDEVAKMFVKEGVVDWSEVKKGFNPAVQVSLAAIWDDVVTETLKKMYPEDRIPSAYDVVNPLTESRIKQQYMRIVETTTGTTETMVEARLRKVRKALAEAGVYGENTIPALQQAILDEFEDMAPWRARRIAVTESSEAVHAAEVISAEGAGIAGWVPVISEDACEKCQVYDSSDNPTGVPRVPFVSQEDAVRLIDAHGYNQDMPPFHPGCRCTKRAVVSTDGLPPSMHRNPTAGKKSGGYEVSASSLMD